MKVQCTVRPFIKEGDYIYVVITCSVNCSEMEKSHYIITLFGDVNLNFWLSHLLAVGSCPL